MYDINKKTKIERFVHWCSKYWLASIIFVLIILALVFWWIPYWATQTTGLFSFDNNSSSIGASIAGTVGVGVAAIAAILTFFAFVVQYEANQQQRASIEHDRLEGRFFELIKLYKASVDEMNIQNVRTGRHCFIPMFKEFKCSYWVTKYEYEKYQSENIANPKIEDEDLCKIAYNIFF